MYIGEVSGFMEDKGYVYILQSSKTNNYYVGSTNNIIDRLQKHNSGFVKSTRARGPWELRFCQEYDSLTNARRIEYKIKQLKNKKIIQQIIEDKKIKLGL